MLGQKICYGTKYKRNSCETNYSAPTAADEYFTGIFWKADFVAKYFLFLIQL